MNVHPLTKIIIDHNMYYELYRGQWTVSNIQHLWINDANAVLGSLISVAHQWLHIIPLKVNNSKNWNDDHQFLMHLQPVIFPQCHIGDKIRQSIESGVLFYSQMCPDKQINSVIKLCLSERCAPNTSISASRVNNNSGPCCYIYSIGLL